MTGQLKGRWSLSILEISWSITRASWPQVQSIERSGSWGSEETGRIRPWPSSTSWPSVGAATSRSSWSGTRRSTAPPTSSSCSAVCGTSTGKRYRSDYLVLPSSLSGGVLGASRATRQTAGTCWDMSRNACRPRLRWPIWCLRSSHWPIKSFCSSSWPIRSLHSR